MFFLHAANALAYCVQIAIVVLVCAGLPRLLRLHAPGAQYVFWRSVLAVALALPLFEPWVRTDAAQAALVWTRSSAGAAPALPAANPPSFAIDGFVVWMAAAVVAGGVLVRFALLAVGLWRLRRLRAETAGGQADDFPDLQRWIGTRATIRWSSAVTHPVTFGWRRPIVLLPPSVAALDAAAARALVAHELFHVRRGDWPWQVAEEVVRAVFWFHPAMWWLVSRVQLARETVVDELSILATNSRRAYMDTLLAFADDSGPLPANAFSRRRHLFHRIMLLSREGSMSARQVTVASLVLAVALAGSAIAAVAAFPLIQAPRDPVPGQLSSEQRAALDRAVEQARTAAAREPNAPDLLNDLSVALWARATRDPEVSESQKVQWLQEAAAAEANALSIRPDYVPALVYKNLVLRALAIESTDLTARQSMLKEADALRDRAMTLQRTARALPPPPPPPPAPQDDFGLLVASTKALRIGGVIRPPTRTHYVAAVYPESAKTGGLQGVVILEALLDPAGRVAATRVLRSVPGLDEAAVDAVKQWEFEPVLLNGAPVSVVMTITVNFSLK